MNDAIDVKDDKPPYPDIILPIFHVVDEDAPKEAADDTVWFSVTPVNKFKAMKLTPIPPNMLPAIKYGVFNDNVIFVAVTVVKLK